MVLIDKKDIYSNQHDERSPLKKSRAEKKRNSFNEDIKIPRDSVKGFPLLTIKEEYYGLDDIIIDKKIRKIIEDIIVENKMGARLKSYGLKPRQKLLFCGPPGTGKTLTAKILSSVMGYPYVYIMFDSILSSYLGETASNLRKIFDFIEQGKWVVLFDEFDIIGKRRDDPYEHGEIKRIVNNFIQMIDTYEGQSIIVAATNHQHLLDAAIWRRFQEVIFFELPDAEKRTLLFMKYLRVLKRTNDLDIVNLAAETEGFSAADISQVCEDSLRKSIINDRPEVNLTDINDAILEQKRRKEAIKN